MMNSFNLALIISIVCSVLLSFFANRFLVKRAALLRLIDEPNHRSSHSVPTPRAGGLGILTGFSLGIVIFSLLFRPVFLINIALFLAWIIAAIGFYDDIVSASPRFRLGIQLLVMACLLLSAHYFFPAILQMNPFFKYIAIMFAFFSGIWLMNLYNFMDGINGIAATEAIFVLLAAAGILHFHSVASSVTPSMLILAAACFGFLVWNFPRAKIFMGDTGSVFLGFMFVFYAVFTVINHQLPLVVWLILLSVFWVDTTYTLLVRILTKQKWHSPHRSHLYQILSRRMQSHVKVVVIIFIYNVFWLLPLSFLANQLNFMKIITLCLAITPILIANIYFGAGKKND